MVSTQLHLGQREPDEIHTHWQTLMKEVYRDSIWNQGSCCTPMNLQYTGTVYRIWGTHSTLFTCDISQLQSWMISFLMPPWSWMTSLVIMSITSPMDCVYDSASDQWLDRTWMIEKATSLCATTLYSNWGTFVCLTYEGFDWRRIFALNNCMFYTALKDKHGWTHEWIICDPGDKSFA